uniref:GB1/RHD3-type G domain-containing protein n=1 Tax=Myotis lucifugus TaxID=59463 RepID=G1QAI1_MYOLU
MASGYTLMDPICLVENQNNQLTVNPTALEILDKISQPVVVVAIAGLYRTGKSYLMNHLAGQIQGFPLGSTVRSETKGIWMWCVPHPSKPNHTLLLLDTEGLGDVEKGDPKNGLWIFLAVLLSSMFIYNSMNHINYQALEQLHYVTELTKLIRTKSSPSSGEGDDSAEFVSFFQLWVVRDFTLELELDGRTITEGECLEMMSAKKIYECEDPQTQKSNMPREYIRKFFPRLKCFVFDQPTNDKKILQNQLEWNFLEQFKNFCQYILTHAKTKTLRKEIIITGNRLGTLAKAYVDAINSGVVPCLENTVTTLAEQENSVALQKAADHYSEQMAQRVRFPTDTLQELLDLHAASEREAIAVFMERSCKDDNQVFQQPKFVETLKAMSTKFMIDNDRAKHTHCQCELRQAACVENLLKAIGPGNFQVAKGQNFHSASLPVVPNDYYKVPGSHSNAHEVLQSFVQSQTVTKESILPADKALTAGEKALAAERAKNWEAEKEQELLRQNRRNSRKKWMPKEHLVQLKEKIRRQSESHLKEQERMLEHKQKIQEELLIEGFENESEKMRKEINQLKK